MAIRRWYGDGVSVKQKSTATVSGVWAQGDTAKLTLNGKSFTVTIGALVTTSEVAQTIAEAINGTTLTDTSASVDVAVTDIGEFYELSASASSSVITLSAETAGKPFDNPTVAESTAGTGAVTNFSTSVSNSGPNVFGTAANWSGNTVPVGGDTLVFDNGDVDLLYELDQSGLSSAVSIEIKQGYSGKIGLPKVNSDSPADYSEYRDDYLKLSVSSLKIGEGDGNGSQRIKIDANASSPTIVVNGTGSDIGSVPALLIKNTGATTTLDVNKGGVGFCYYDGETGTIKTTRVGYKTSINGDARVEIGSGATISGAGTSITQIGGRLKIDSSTTLIDMNGGRLNVMSGVHAEINIDSGECNYQSTGTLTALKIGNGGIADFSKDMRARTVTSTSMYSGASLSDPNKTVEFTNDVQMVRAGLQDMSNLDFGTDIQIGVATI